MAYAWEDFAGAIGCDILDDEHTDGAKVTTAWVYVAISLVVCLPTAYFVGSRAKAAADDAAEKVKAFHETHPLPSDGEVVDVKVRPAAPAVVLETARSMA